MLSLQPHCLPRSVLRNGARNNARITYGDTGLSRLDGDPRFRAAVERLLQSGTPGLLMHLPHVSEVEKGTEFCYRRPYNGVPRDRGKSLRQSLERALRMETIGLLPYMSEMRPIRTPSCSDRRTNANKRGLELYADAVARAFAICPATGSVRIANARATASA